MDNIKEKLVELLCHKLSLRPNCDFPTGDCGCCRRIADHLIANGVTILNAQESISKLEEENKRLLRRVNGVTLEEWLGGEDNQKVLSEPQTNADRIRAMSDEELASTMYGLVGLDDRIYFCQNKEECDALLEEGEEIPEQDCVSCLVAWLQQPAEEVEHE